MKPYTWTAFFVGITVLIGATLYSYGDGVAPPKEETGGRAADVGRSKSAVDAPAERSAGASVASGEEINWQVISSGGTDASSTNFRLAGTAAQTAVGTGSSPSFGLSHGFWQKSGVATCCNGDGMRGNVDDLVGPAGEVDVADLTYLVGYLFQGGPTPPCEEEGNVDAIVGPGGPIDVADLTYLVSYLFQGGPAPAACP